MDLLQKRATEDFSREIAVQPAFTEKIDSCSFNDIHLTHIIISIILIMTGIFTPLETHENHIAFSLTQNSFVKTAKHT